MFTGIVKDIGKILYIRNAQICLSTQIKDIQPSESVLVNGVCLTVNDSNKNNLTFDIGVETLKATNLKKLKSGDKVNLEDAMRLSDKIGGHIVYGHIMEIGKIISRRISANTLLLKIKVSSGFINKLIEKGSVAINGVSLTINKLENFFFTVALINETLKRTNLGSLRNSDEVNLEADMLVAK